MEPSGRRVLLAVAPGVLEGAPARLLSVRSNDEVVPVGRIGLTLGGAEQVVELLEQYADSG